MKKRWEKPRLIVLVKGEHEESVLAYCKAVIASGPDGWENTCSYEAEGGGCPCFDMPIS